MALFSLLVFSPQYGKAFAQPSDTDSPASNGVDLQGASLRSQTAHGTYTVELDWQPRSIPAGNDTTFDTRFLDKSGMHPANKKINYDFTVSGADLSPIQEFYNQTTDENGIGKPLMVRFEKQGPIEITVWVNYSDPNVSLESESATFDMTVTPEFPLGISITFVAGAAMVAAVAVFSILRFGRQQPNAGISL